MNPCYWDEDVSYYGSEMDIEFSRIKREWERYALFLLRVGLILGFAAGYLLAIILELLS